MSIRLMTQIFEYPMPDLTTGKNKTVSASTSTFILLALADHANDEGENAYPSLDLLVRKTKLTRQTVISALQALEASGYINKIGRSRKGTSEYKINADLLGSTQYTSTQFTMGVNSVDYQGKPSIPEPSYNHTEPLPAPKILSEKQAEKKKQYYPIMLALSEVTGLSFTINGKVLGEAAKNLLRDERVSPELIRSIYSQGGVWYRQDWRGKRGEKPTLRQINETIFKFEKTDDVVRGYQP